MSSPWASTHASASCDGRHRFSAAIASIRRTSSMFRWKLSLRKPEKTHLPLAHKIRHGSHGVFNGRIQIDPMLVVEVDHVHAETAKAGLTSGANIFRSAIDPTYIGIGTSDNAELGGQKHLVT